MTSGEGVDKVVVLEQRRAKNIVNSKTYIRFLLRCFLCRDPHPPTVLYCVGPAIKKEAKIFSFGTKS